MPSVMLVLVGTTELLNSGRLQVRGAIGISAFSAEHLPHVFILSAERPSVGDPCPSDSRPPRKREMVMLYRTSRRGISGDGLRLQIELAAVEADHGGTIDRGFGTPVRLLD